MCTCIKYFDTCIYASSFGHICVPVYVIRIYDMCVMIRVCACMYMYSYHVFVQRLRHIRITCAMALICMWFLRGMSMIVS